MRSSFRFAGLVLGLTASALFAAVKIDTQVVGPAPDPSVPGYRISPRGVHYAVLTMRGSKSTVVIDGAAGPLFDDLLDTHGNRSLTCANAVVFSRDGDHAAYLARAGNDYLVVLDGKELIRGPYTNIAVTYGELTFSPTGKHLFYVEEQSPASGPSEYRLVMDGKRGPVSGHQTMVPVFSPDDSHWAYVAKKFNVAGDQFFTVIDGSEKPFVGNNLRYTADNRLIILKIGTTADGGPAVLVDGKVVIKAASVSDKIWIPSKGSHYAVAAQLKAGEGNGLFLDGSPVRGATSPEEVVFSPDGKRWIAICRTAAGAHIAIVDGKASQEYRTIALPVFTPDSSKAMFQASNGSKNFLVVEGAESDGFEYMSGQVPGPVMSAQGSHFAYATNDGMNRAFSMVVDGKSIPLGDRRVVGDSVRLSPDGSRFLYATLPAARNDNGALVLDGKEIADVVAQEFPLTQYEKFSSAEFSPDGKHIVYRGALRADRQKNGVALDDQLVFLGSGFVRRPTFTPDSQHVLWALREFSPTVKPHYQLYVDGRPALTFAESFESEPWSWAMGADGVLQFLAKDGADVKRYRVTPDSETSLATMAADFATAEAAKISAADKAKADAAEAQAKAKADAAAAAAKAKADSDAAYAAKAKAREDAIAAKAKARADAAAAKKAK